MTTSNASAKMRIAMYMPYSRPGSMGWTIYQDFAAALRHAGADFTFIVDEPDSPTACPLGTEFLPPPSAAAGLIDKLLRPATRTTALASTAIRIARWLRRNPDVDALYMEMTYPLGSAAWLGRALSGWRGALIMTPMGEDFLILDEASYGHRRYPLPRWLIERTMRAAAAVRCISPMVLEYTTDYGHPAAMVPLNVANSTLAARSTPPQDAKVARARLRDELQFTRRGLALSLGRLHPFKGIHVLVQAMVHTPDVDLVIAGPTLRVGEYGDYGQYLAEEARRLGVNDRVHLLGAVPHEDVSALMAAADVVVVPSLLESMNRVCAEAAASGTPFIVTSSTGAADLVQEPGVGQVVAPRDPEAIAAAINDVVSGTWEADVEAAGRFVDQFDASAIAPQLLALIREGIGRR